MKRHFLNYCRSPSDIAQFLRFATVGAKVSLIDAGGLYLLQWLTDLNIYAARVISFSLAMLAGYLLNRYFTFKGLQKGGFLRQLAGHFGVHLLGGIINFGVFYAIVELGQAYISGKIFLMILPLLALWVGGVAGMAFNFVFSKKLVFRVKNRKPKHGKENLRLRELSQVDSSS
jgi:putative flippase GtrA